MDQQNNNNNIQTEALYMLGTLCFIFISVLIGNLLSKTNRIHFNNDRVYFYPILFCVYM